MVEHVGHRAVCFDRSTSSLRHAADVADSALTDVAARSRRSAAERSVFAIGAGDLQSHGLGCVSD